MDAFERWRASFERSRAAMDAIQERTGNEVGGEGTKAEEDDVEEAIEDVHTTLSALASHAHAATDGALRWHIGKFSD